MGRKMNRQERGSKHRERGGERGRKKCRKKGSKERRGDKQGIANIKVERGEKGKDKNEN